MPSFGPISSAPVGAATNSSGTSATAYPVGVSAFASIGVAVATGGATGSATAYPLGVVAYAQVGQFYPVTVTLANFNLSTIMRFAPINRHATMSNAALNLTANLL